MRWVLRNASTAYVYYIYSVIRPLAPTVTLEVAITTFPETNSNMTEVDVEGAPVIWAKVTSREAPSAKLEVAYRTSTGRR